MHDIIIRGGIMKLYNRFMIPYFLCDKMPEVDTSVEAALE